MKEKEDIKSQLEQKIKEIDNKLQLQGQKIQEQYDIQDELWEERDKVQKQLDEVLFKDYLVEVLCNLEILKSISRYHFSYVIPKLDIETQRKIYQHETFQEYIKKHVYFRDIIAVIATFDETIIDEFLPLLKKVEIFDYLKLFTETKNKKYLAMLIDELNKIKETKPEEYDEYIKYIANTLIKDDYASLLSEEQFEYLNNNSSTLNNGTKLSELLKRTELTYNLLEEIDEERPILTKQEIEEVEIQIKYEGYIKLQDSQVEKFKKLPLYYENRLATPEEKEAEFTKALNAALRSDPDVMMVGEIRSLSAAELCFKGALSGHGMWSTLHANSAPAIITRFRDMGVQPYMLGDPELMKGLISQRLFRKLCPHCRKSIKERYGDPSYERLKTALGDLGIEHTYIRGDGCKACGYKGVSGRMSVPEIILPDAVFLDMMVKGETKRAIDYWTADLGGRTLKEAAMERMLKGVMDLDEVERWCGLLDQRPAY